MAIQMRKLAALCVLVECLDDESEEKRQKGPDRKWLKRREEKGSFGNIVKELAAEDSPSFKHYMRMDYNSFRQLVHIISPRFSCSLGELRPTNRLSPRINLSTPLLLRLSTAFSFLFT